MDEEHNAGGTLIACDMYEIENAWILSDKEAIEKLLVNAAVASGAHVVDVHTPKYFIGKGGLTSFATVKESALTIHGYDKEKKAFLDFYTCGGVADPRKGIKYATNELKPKIVNVTQIKRGNVQNLEIGLISRKAVEKPFGYTLLIDAYKCPVKKLDDMDITYDFLDILPKMFNHESPTIPYVSRTYGIDRAYVGLSGGVDLPDNGYAHIITAPAKRIVILDVLSTTKNFDIDAIKKELIRAYKPKDVDDPQLLLRGVDY